MQAVSQPVAQEQIRQDSKAGQSDKAVSKLHSSPAKTSSVSMGGSGFHPAVAKHLQAQKSVQR